MSAIEDAKFRLRRLPEEVGLGRLYHHLWWSARGRTKGLITDWSRQHRAIFVHVPKTAGMSVSEMFGMRRPADYHAPACAYRAADPAFFTAAFKFAVVRNPWDRLVSAFHYSLFTSPFAQERAWGARHLAPFDDFGQFVRALRARSFRALVFQRLIFMPQSYFVCDLAGRVQVNEAIPFEDLGRRLAETAAHLGVALTPARVNASDHAPYASYYTEETQDIVGRLYRADVAAFGYEFDARQASAVAQAAE
jgi:hypothetical protein